MSAFSKLFFVQGVWFFKVIGENYQFDCCVDGSINFVRVYLNEVYFIAIFCKIDLGHWSYLSYHSDN